MYLLHNELTSLIIKTFYDVYNELGHGFLEKVYQNALLIELKNKGLEVTSNEKIKVYYKGENVGDYYADIIVNDTIILELKAADYIVEIKCDNILSNSVYNVTKNGYIYTYSSCPLISKELHKVKDPNYIEEFSFLFR